MGKMKCTYHSLCEKGLAGDCVIKDRNMADSIMIQGGSKDYRGCIKNLFLDKFDGVNDLYVLVDMFKIDSYQNEIERVLTMKILISLLSRTNYNSEEHWVNALESSEFYNNDIDKSNGMVFIYNMVGFFKHLQKFNINLYKKIQHLLLSQDFKVSVSSLSKFSLKIHNLISCLANPYLRKILSEDDALKFLSLGVIENLSPHAFLSLTIKMNSRYPSMRFISYINIESFISTVERSLYDIYNANISSDNFKMFDTILHKCDILYRLVSEPLLVSEPINDNFVEVAKYFLNNHRRLKNSKPEDIIKSFNRHQQQNTILKMQELKEIMTNKDIYDFTVAELCKWGINIDSEILSELEKWYKDIVTYKDNPNLEIDIKITDDYSIKTIHKHDPAVLFLGKHTDCCQSIDGAGSTCVWAGLKSKESGFIGIYKHSEKRYIAQSWIYEIPIEFVIGSGHKVLVIDNIEALSGYDDIVIEGYKLAIRHFRKIYSVISIGNTDCIDVRVLSNKHTTPMRSAYIDTMMGYMSELIGKKVYSDATYSSVIYQQ